MRARERERVKTIMEPSISLPLQRATKNNHQAECPAFYIYTLIVFLLMITFQSLIIQNITTTTTPSPPPSPLTFHPLKDPSVPPYTNPNRTWFMSTLTGRVTRGMPEHFIFPSLSYDKFLCVEPRNKSYALATTFPTGVAIARGLTFIADSFYDYENPWHGLNAVTPFFAWMMENERWERPARWVLFKNGEVVGRLGRWVLNVMESVLDGGVMVDGLEGVGMVCFERAVVFRRGLGGMDGGMRNKVFEMVRCKAWRYCEVDEGLHEEERVGESRVRICLLGREGKRGFKDESGVRRVMERECGKVKGCKLRLVHFHNMSFCDQVKIMRNTDILTSTHGAQLTNMVFMPEGSSVMEMFPTGWLEGAGVGQFIYQWFASWSQMHYEGAWRDSEGFNCTKLSVRRSKCFSIQKDQQVGINETYLASWIKKVIHGSLTRKQNSSSSITNHSMC